jgi:hypothetical protein
VRKSAVERPWERKFLDVAMHMANWWLAHAPADRVAFWDFDAPVGPDTPRDTSGTAIAAAALLKLAALAPEETRRARYHAVAEAMVAALVERYLNARGDPLPRLLQPADQPRNPVRADLGLVLSLRGPPRAEGTLPPARI